MSKLLRTSQEAQTIPRTLYCLSTLLFFRGPLFSHLSLTVSVQVMVDNGSRKLPDMVAGRLDVFCFLSKNFAIWGFPGSQDCVSIPKCKRYPDSPSPSVLGRKCRTPLDACLTCHQLLMLVRWWQHSSREVEHSRGTQT